MSHRVDQVVPVVEREIRGEFERIWESVTSTSPAAYRIIIWGSVADSRDREPNDLDLIFEYEGESLTDSKETSIESWLENAVDIGEFPRIDPLVTHVQNTPDIISRSRCSRVYSVDDGEWLEFDS